MKERTQAILDASLRDFIKYGAPITSERLYEHYDFGIKPAMIRHELGVLSEEGYFYQTHPSGGRIPTNKAYRFFVASLLKEDIARTSHAMEQMIEEWQNNPYASLVKEVARTLNVCAVGAVIGEGEIYESGLESLLTRLEIEEKQELKRALNHLFESNAVHYKKRIVLEE